MKASLKVFIGALALVLTSCGSNNGAQVEIPDVQMSCTTSRCTSASGSYFAVSYITSSGCAADQMDYGAVAIGTATATCSSIGCFASVTSWNNAETQPITKIGQDGYRICNWIDLDNNGMKTAGVDEFSEVIIYIDASSTSVNAGSATWGASYAGNN